jgi:hypothetical protein
MPNLRDGCAAEEPVLSLPKESREFFRRDVTPGNSPRAASCARLQAEFKFETVSASFDSPQSQSSLGFAQDDNRGSFGKCQHASRRSQKGLRSITTVFVLLLALSLITGQAQSTRTDGRPAVTLNAEHAVPHEVNETVQQALVRDYASAWQALETALESSSATALNDNFVGFAQDQLTQRIKDQRETGLKTRIVDRGHAVEAIFYSPEGAAVELRDTATLETQILDGETVIHSERARVRYYAILTGAEDRWKIRVLESAAIQDDK